MNLEESILNKAKQYDAASKVVNNQLLLNNQTFNLTPLLRLPQRMLNSPEFTHLPPLFDASENFPIADMYVELRVASVKGVAHPVLLQHGRTIAEEQKERQQRHASQPLSLDHCINLTQHQHIVILGDPGSGKTSLLKHLCLDIVSTNSPRWLIPIFISLRRYWIEKQKTPSMSLLHYASISLFGQQAANNLSSQYSLLLQGAYHHNRSEINGLEQLLLHLSGDKKETILFLLDGLDEIATNNTAIEIITQDIRQLSQHFSWILTSRHSGFFGDLEQDICYDIISLNKAGIEELVLSWFRNSNTPDRQTKQQELLRQIETNSRLRDMASNPFLLTLLCHIQYYAQKKSLPLYRIDIYATIIELIRLQLRNANKDNTLFRTPEMSYLAKFCYYLYTTAPNAPLQIFEYDHWEDCAKPHTPPSFDQHFLSSRLIHSWRQGGDFHFIHLTFQEYLIALYIADTSFEAVKQYIFSPHWKMVFRFLAGIYGKHSNFKMLKMLLNTLLNTIDQIGFLYLEATHYLIEANIENSTELLGYDMRDKLWNLSLDSQSLLKETAGELLALLSPNFIIKNIIHIEAHLEQPTPNSWQSIKLLGFINNTEADYLILKLLNSKNTEIQEYALTALAQKNTSNLRQAVIELYTASPRENLNLLCTVAAKTKHKDFFSHLATYLHKEPEKLIDYNPILQTITTIGAANFKDELLNFINFYSPTLLTDKAIEAVISLQDEQSREWFKSILLIKNAELAYTASYYAIQYNILTAEELLHLYTKADYSYKQIWLNAILKQSAVSDKIPKSSITILLELLFSNSEHSLQILTILSRSDLYSLINTDQLLKLADFCRPILDQPHSELATNAIKILGAIKDISAYTKIKAIAFKQDDYQYQACAIYAMANYTAIYPNEVKDTLHSLYHRINQHNIRLKKDILTVLANIDLSEIMRYRTEPILQAIINTLCAQQGVLLFEEGYIDHSGIKHLFNPLPKLSLNTPAQDQLDQLRLACNYALEKNLIQKTSSKRGEIKPLFQKTQAGYNDYYFPDSVDVNTGNKFIRGGSIKAETAQRIMNRLQLICPMLFDH